MLVEHQLVAAEAEQAPKVDKPKKAPGKKFQLKLPWWAWVTVISGAVLLTTLVCIICFPVIIPPRVGE